MTTSTMTEIEDTVIVKDERNLQKLAEKLHVNYYSFFKTLIFNDSEETDNKYKRRFLPVAEVYQEGRWREHIIGGRYYYDANIANNIVKAASKAQEVFLRSLAETRISFMSGLTNPIDNWKYELEPDRF